MAAEFRDLKKSLQNYIELRMPEAKHLGYDKDLEKAVTLTQARKIMQGQKLVK